MLLPVDARLAGECMDCVFWMLRFISTVCPQAERWSRCLSSCDGIRRTRGLKRDGVLKRRMPTPMCRCLFVNLNTEYKSTYLNIVMCSSYSSFHVGFTLISLDLQQSCFNPEARPWIIHYRATNSLSSPQMTQLKKLLLNYFSFNFHECKFEFGSLKFLLESSYTNLHAARHQTHVKHWFFISVYIICLHLHHQTYSKPKISNNKQIWMSGVKGNEEKGIKSKKLRLYAMTNSKYARNMNHK